MVIAPELVLRLFPISEQRLMQTVVRGCEWLIERCKPPLFSFDWRTVAAQTLHTTQARILYAKPKPILPRMQASLTRSDNYVTQLTAGGITQYNAMGLERDISHKSTLFFEFAASSTLLHTLRLLKLWDIPTQDEGQPTIPQRTALRTVVFLAVLQFRGPSSCASNLISSCRT